MEKYLDKLPSFVEAIKSMKETIIANIVFIGQIPAPTFKEKRRTDFFMERLAEFQVDECTTDGYRNPIGIIRGNSPSKPPIFVVAHIDTVFESDIDHNYTVKKKTIKGAGILDNSLGVGVLASLPEIFRKLDLCFESDIVLAGVIQSLGRGNLRGIRHLLKTWDTPIRGAICLKGAVRPPGLASNIPNSCCWISSSQRSAVRSTALYSILSLNSSHAFIQGA
ncbi:MAG: hypothetical protein KKD12_05210 [Proteobacteria bacterium]|nr:hypothetical protein [Pseudomonadota bacterium]